MNSLLINMSSSSSISIPNPMKYDVFLSFRFADVGDNFVSHLYSALCLKKIKTYWNPHEDPVNEDEKFSFEATKAIIEESKLSVVIFSENYASSPKCLHELVHVLECKGKGKFVVPVFYHVDPSNLSKQKGSKIETTSIDEVDEWRRALEAARSLTGWSSSEIMPESKLVAEIVEDVVKRLNRISPYNNSEFLVGIDERIEKIESLLRIGSSDAFRIVGIFGLGGVGKSTLAHVVYKKLYSHFESCYFLWNVKDESKRHGLINLRNKLLAELLGKTYQDLSYPSFGPTFSPEKFRRKRVLIVLDDVNNSYQFKLLASKQKLFGHGSRIIVTTRDIQVLKSITADIYRIEELNYQEALQLFHSTCFQKISPTKKNWELSKQIADYANGNPLALKILGSNFEAWEDVLTKLKEAPKFTIAKTLKICYDALDSNQKDIFLDIACFFRGQKRGLVERILDCCSNFASDAIDDLIAKSLITLGPSNELQMHDLVQEMGHEIVRHESFMESGIHSRLSSAKDTHEVLKYNKGTAAMKGISLDMSEIEEELHLDPRTFKEMTNLRLLKIYSSSTDTPKTQYIHGDLSSFPNTLRYLQWEGYPLTSLPQNFSPTNLVELNLSHSNLEKLWNGVQSLVKLKTINLSHSLNLVQVPDLSRAPNLESINIRCCMSLSAVPSDFQHLDQLTTLNLNGCLSLDKFPELPRNIKKLNMSGTSIENLPSSIERLSCLKTLELSNCKRLESLPSSIGKLTALEHLNLSGCSKFECFPEIVETMIHLQFLSLNETRIRELRSSIGNLVALEVLELEGCENLESLPQNIYRLSKLKRLIASHCAKLKALPGPGQFVHFPSLSQLSLNNCSILKVPDDQLSIFSTLESLDLSGNENIEGLPSNIKQLSKLIHLDISNCKNLRSLPEIPLSLETVDAHGCTSLKKVSSSKIALNRGCDHYACSEKLVFFNCLKLDENARNNLIIDSQLRILRMATVSRIKSKHVIEYPSVSICYPGYQIPEWFSNTTAGSSISIKLSPHWKNTNFLGFSLCVVAAPFAEHKFHPQLHFHCESHFRFKDGESRTLKCFLTGYSQDNDDEDKSRIFLKSDHVFLWYVPFHHGLEDMLSTCTEALFEFYPTDSLEEKVNFCEVKECGIRMLYLQETAKFDLIEYYPVWEPKVEESTALCGDNSSSERGTSDPNNGIEELEEEEEDVILRESQPSSDGDVDSNIGGEGIYKKELNSSGCLSFLSQIKECWEHRLGKKSGRQDEGFGYGLRPGLSTSRGTSLPLTIAHQLQEAKKTINHMHSQITELENDLVHLKRMTQRQK